MCGEIVDIMSYNLCQQSIDRAGQCEILQFAETVTPGNKSL